MSVENISPSYASISCVEWFRLRTKKGWIRLGCRFGTAYPRLRPDRVDISTLMTFIELPIIVWKSIS